MPPLGGEWALGEGLVADRALQRGAARAAELGDQDENCTGMQSCITTFLGACQ